MITARDVSRRLAENAQEVCEYLLPNGKPQGPDWVAGNIHGAAGQSLKVRLTGDRAGLWIDFGDKDRSGDLLALWAATRDTTIRQARLEAIEWLRIDVPTFAGSNARRTKLQPAKPSADLSALAWLRDSRRIPQTTIDAYQVTAQRDAIVFPAHAPDGSVQYRKFRSVREKRFWSEKGGKPCLFGWQAIDGNQRSVVIAEGEMDALAWHAYGFPALSPTNGAGCLDWIDIEFDELARFDEILLSWDMDEAGQKELPRIIERLGSDRCRIVCLPHKDANQCLMAKVPKEAMAEAIRKAESADPKELVCASDFAAKVIEEFYGEQRHEGVTFPWDKGSRAFAFRRGEVSLLAGVNGHGKSIMAGHLLLGALEQGERACVASMEFKPEKWLARLARQATACIEPTTKYIEDVHDWYQNRLWVLAATGSVSASRILEVFRYAARRYGIHWFVVDNLAKCGIAEDDYNGQKRFVDELTDFARDFGVHVMLVLHMRKGESEDRPANKMDIKGTGAITDMADSVLLIWRNKPKESKRRLAEIGREEFDESSDADAVLRVVKQRNGEDEPSIRLWFDRKSMQFRDSYRHTPKPFVGAKLTVVRTEDL